MSSICAMSSLNKMRLPWVRNSALQHRKRGIDVSFCRATEIRIVSEFILAFGKPLPARDNVARGMQDPVLLHSPRHRR